MANPTSPDPSIAREGAAVGSAPGSCAELPTATARQIEWLWPGRLPLGAITLLSGDPDVGKSFLTLEIAACVSTGEAWPDGGANERGSAIIISAEDDEQTIGSRLHWLSADLNQVRHFDQIEFRDGDRTLTRSFDLGRDVQRLTSAVENLGDCRLVVIDPVTAFLGRVSENANNQVRNLLAPLAELAATHRLAVVLVSHLRKKRGPAMYQTLGCQAFVALPRACWTVVIDPKDPKRRILFSTKRNCGPDPGALAFRFESLGPNDGAFILWDDDVVEVPSDSTEPHGSLANRPAVRQQQAVEWLRWFLADGAKPAQEVTLASEGYAISEGTLRRARDDLGVESVKSRGTKHGCWLWQLPTKL